MVATSLMDYALGHRWRIRVNIEHPVSLPNINLEAELNSITQTDFVRSQARES
jgi:hypothetical protein